MLPKITAFDGQEHQPFTLNGGTGAALLVHGFPGTPNEMRPFAQILHAEGWTTRAVLLPGFGPQINALTQYTYDDWLEHVLINVADLRQKHHPLILVGHSMGGALVTAAAAKLKPDAVVLFAPFRTLDHFLWKAMPALKVIMPRFKPFKLMKPDFSDPNFRAGIERFMPGLDLDDPEVRDGIKNFEIPMGLLAHIHKSGQMAHRRAPDVTCPTLIIQGSKDALVTPENTRVLLERISGKTKYVEVQADHELFSTVSPAWQDIRTALVGFAQQIRLSHTHITGAS